MGTCFLKENEKRVWIAVFLYWLRPVRNRWCNCIRKLTKTLLAERRRFLAVWGRYEHRLCENQSLQFCFKVDVPWFWHHREVRGSMNLTNMFPPSKGSDCSVYMDCYLLLLADDDKI